MTAHRAQGLTVDTAHVVVFDTTTRENLYVAMTRGREHNHAYVILDTADDNHGADGEGGTARSVLVGVLANSGAELSAHQMITTEQTAWTSIAQLAAEYETIAAAAQRDRWAMLIRSCPLTPDEADAAIESEAFRPTRRGTATCRSQRSRHRTAAPSGRRPIRTRRCRGRRSGAPPPARARNQARRDQPGSTAGQAHRRPHPRSARPDGTRHARGP
ncbi:C-terminal helicase domain-containing protein [Nocardioides sp. B-3]|uniref:C-terminal helicase domain-containing protein n=1 Tax=Nocardioides sp. B-3 TaxID=2895565 RepID=UPI003FA5FC6D